MLFFRSKLSNFLSVLSLYDILYPEKEPLPVPDCTKAYCTRQVISFYLSFNFFFPKTVRFRWHQHAFGFTCTRKRIQNILTSTDPCRQHWKNTTSNYRCFSNEKLMLNVFFVLRFLQHLMMSNNAPLSMGTDFIIVLMCNTYSTHPVRICQKF